MKNEWKENFWLLLELIIVSVAVWYLAVMMTSRMYGIFQPRGFEYEDVYVATLKRIKPESPLYAQPEDTTIEGRYKATADDIRMMMESMRSYPYVEAVGVGANALPYQFNYYGTGYFMVKDSGDTVLFNGNARTVTPDMAEVLRYQSRTGQTHAQMRDALAKGQLLLAPGMALELTDKNRAALAGQLLHSYYDAKEFRVGGIVNIVRRSDYEEAYSGTFILPIDESDDRNLVDNTEAIAIRVKPGYGSRLMEEFRNNPEFSRRRNLLMRNLRSLETARTVAQWQDNVLLRQYGAGMLCLFIIVFLGLLGTFWFRVQQRVGEIAIRKVAGARSRDIFRRMMSESLILVAFATLIAWALDAAMIYFDLVAIYDWKKYVAVLVLCALAVLVMLVLAVAAGVCLPARRAMGIEPAIALKSE